MTGIRQIRPTATEVERWQRYWERYPQIGTSKYGRRWPSEMEASGSLKAALDARRIAAQLSILGPAIVAVNGLAGWLEQHHMLRDLYWIGGTGWLQVGLIVGLLSFFFRARADLADVKTKRMETIFRHEVNRVEIAEELYVYTMETEWTLPKLTAMLEFWLIQMAEHTEHAYDHNNYSTLRRIYEPTPIEDFPALVKQVGVVETARILLDEGLKAKQIVLTRGPGINPRDKLVIDSYRAYYATYEFDLSDSLAGHKVIPDKSNASATLDVASVKLV